jgi:hypothetical protein
MNPIVRNSFLLGDPPRMFSLHAVVPVTFLDRLVAGLRRSLLAAFRGGGS